MRRLLPAALVLLCASPAAAAHLFLSTERPFEPDSPGAVVKLEVRGARSVDVRLYRLADPEHFFATQRNPHRVQEPDRRSEPKRRDDSGRAPGAAALLARSLGQGASDLRKAAHAGLTPAARSLLASALDPPRPAGASALPFLKGLELVERWDLACGAADDEFGYCDLDIGPRPSGAYLVEAISGKEVAHAVALFTRLSLLARRSPGQLTVLAVDGQTGQALPNVQLLALSQGQQIGRLTTNKQGLAQLHPPQKPLLILGRRDADAALLEIGVPAPPVAEERTLVLTDRGEYRPGERVLFHGFTRGERLELPREEQAEVAAYDSRGNRFWHRRLAVSNQGGFGGQFELPAGLPQGVYRLVAQIGDAVGGAELVVRASPAPAFDLAVALQAKVAGEPAMAQVRSTIAGRPLPVQLAWRAVRYPITDEGESSPEEVDRGDVAAGEDGTAVISFDTAAEVSARYEVSLVARDDHERAATAVAEATVTRRPLRAPITLERRLVPPGTPVQVTVQTLGLDDRPEPADLKVRVQAAHSAAGGEVTRDKVVNQQLSAGADGKATFTFTPAAGGYYEVEILHGQERLGETFLYVTREGGDIPFSPDTLALVPDKPSYAVGEIAHVLVLAPFDAAVALMAVEGEDSHQAAALPIRAASAVYSFKVTASHAPDFTVSAQAVVGGKAWRRERLLRVLPQSGSLAVQGKVRIEGAEGVVELAAVDRSGKPAAGAEVFLVARDERSVPSPAPSMPGFFVPERRSDALSETSTGYRSSTPGRSASPSPERTVEEGYRPFKGLPQGKPRANNAGTLAATALSLDAQGKALMRFELPADVRRVALEARVADGSAFADWTGRLERASEVELLAPHFLRAGDWAQARARGGSGLAQLTAGTATARAPAPDRLEIQAQGERIELEARYSGGERIWRSIPVLASDAEALAGTSGQSSAGRTRLPYSPGARLQLTSGLTGLVRACRPAMGEQVAWMTEDALGRVLADLAAGRSGKVSDEERRRGQVDLAALLGLFHPEGQLGAFDGAPADARLAAIAGAVLWLARIDGYDLEESLLERLTARLEAPAAGSWAAFATSLAGGRAEAALKLLREKERRGELPIADRALAILALAHSGEVGAARELAERLERSARPAATGSCFSDSGCSPSRAVTEATALTVLALQLTLPRSPLLPAATRYLVAQRGRGDFGGGLAGGLATLALASAAGNAPEPAATGSLECAARRSQTLKVDGQGETEATLPFGDCALVASRGTIYWRLLSRSSAGTGPLQIARSIKPVAADGKPSERPIRQGDLLEVELTLTADEATGPVMIEDPYPAGLAPIEQEGERESHKQLSERSQRDFTRDRVIFLLPSLKAGATMLRWQAIARIPGTFSAPPASARGAEPLGRSVPLTLTVEALP